MTFAVLTAPDLAGAIADNDFIELTFTTLPSFASDDAFLEAIFHGTQNTGGGGNNFADFDFAVVASDDGFATAGQTLVNSYNVDRDDGGYNFRVVETDLGYELAEDTTYSFRFYLFNDQGTGNIGSNGNVDEIGRVTFDDTFFFVSGDSFADNDGDGASNHCDFDSDNDGISDLVESGNALAILADTDGDGVITGEEAAIAGLVDLDGDGAYDQLGSTVDSDGDGVDDFLDLDSDGDGIPDTVEAQPTTPYVAPTGVDTDGDGVDDAFDDPAVEHGAAFITPVDTDGDGVADYLDTDSDNDGIDDVVESGLTPGADNNGDGIADNIAPNSYSDPDGIVADPINDLDNVDSDASDVDYRSINLEAVDDAVVGTEDTPVAFNPLANDDSTLDIVSMEIQNVPDSALEGTLTYTDAGGNVVTVAPGAVLTPEEAATLVFTPVMDFSGPVPPINYVVTDENGQTAAAMINLTITPTPDAEDDAFVTNEDTPVLLNPLSNDDVGAGAQSVTIDNIPDGATEGILTYTDAAGNTVTVMPGDVLTPAEAATLTFDPVMDFSGTVPTINYTVTDINGATSDAMIDITVTPTPDAVDDVFVTNEDTPVLLNPLSNDDLADGAQSVTINNIPDGATEGALTYTDAAGNVVTVMAGAVLTPEEAATLTFEPVVDFSGPVPPINYTVTDINGATSDAMIDITVTPTPDAVDDVFVTNEDTPVSVNPLTNDDDGAGVASVTVDTIPDPAEGVLTYIDDATGLPVAVAPGDVLSPLEAASLEFTPEEDFNGPVTPIEYTLTDINGEESPAMIDITVTPTPDAMDDVFFTDEDTPVAVNPLTNDDDGAGIDSVTVDTIPDPAEGVLTYINDATGLPVAVIPGDVLSPLEAASLEFTPTPDFNGPVTPIEYTLTDINGEGSPAMIDISVGPTPDAVDDAFVTNEDTPVLLNPLSNDDLGAGAQSVTVNNVPDPATQGVLTYTDAAGNVVTVMPGDVLTPEEAATLTFDPVMDFNGPVPPIGYTVEDINGNTSDAEINIEVTPTPDAVDDSFVTNEDTPVSVNPLTNDDDGAGIASVTVDTIPDPAEGVLTYIDDATGLPVAVAPGDVLSPEEAASLEFTPEPDFNGPVTPIEYTLTDINGEGSPAMIDITVTPTPDAVDDTFVSNEDTPVLLNPLANDDVGAGADSLTVNNVPDPALEGTLTYLDAAGNPVVVMAGDVLTPEQAATLTFNPVMDFNGTVPPVNYTVTDINGETSDADILIEIIPTPDAVDDAFVTNEDTPVSVNPLTNDDDGAGIASVTVDTVPDPAEGTLTYIDDATGLPVAVAPGDVLSPEEAASLEFTPEPDFNGPVTPIEYTLTDINGEESPAEIAIDITPTPDAVDDAVVTNEDTPVAVDPLANDDVGAGAASVTINNVPDPATEGAFTYIDDATGLPVAVSATDVLSPEEAASLVFTPVDDFNGMVTTVAYTVTDVNGETSDANIDITVTPTPDAVDDEFSGNEDTPVALDPLSNDDLGAGADSVEILNVPDPLVEGTLTYLDDAGNPVVVAAGDVLTPEQAATLVFNPVPDFNGPVAPINYEVTDINGETSAAMIDIAIIPTPDAVDDALVTNEDTPVSVNPLTNDDDGAGIASVTVDAIPDPAEGVLTYIDDATGLPVAVAPGDVLSPEEAASLEFTPEPDFNGPITPIEYTLTDINGEGSPAMIDVTVTPTPDAVDDTFVANEDTPVLLNPLSNDDVGTGADSVTVNNVPDPALEGTLTYLDAAGNPVVVMAGDVLTPEQAATLTFNPVMDFNGTVPPINYTVTDINGETSDADILIEIIPTPDAVDDPFTTNEDTPVNVSPLGNDDDGAGIQSVTVDSVPPAAEGVLTYTDANGVEVLVTPGTVLTAAEAATLTFTPEEDFNGPVTPIDYTLTDINGATSEADILIDVTPTPDAVDDAVVTNEDTPIAVDPLANDDVGAGAASVTINNVPDPATEGTFTYIDDATGLPVAVSANDVLSPEEAASLVFTPVDDFNGVVTTVAYTVTDVNGETSDANIDITVTPTPDSVDDVYSGNEDTPVALDPLSNDDLGAGADSVAILNVPDPALEGTLTYLDDAGNPVVVAAGDVLTPEQAATLVFNPVPDFNGPVAPINYEVTDINGETSAAMIDIAIIPTPDAVDDTLVTNEDTPVSVNPLTNDDDGAGIASVTVDAIPDPAEGVLTYIDDVTGLSVAVAPGDVLSPIEAASLEFTPEAGFIGAVTPIEYTLTDINGETSPAEIAINVNPTPEAVEDVVTTTQDSPVALDPLANDDLGAGAQSVTINNVPDGATEGTLTYTDADGNVVTVAPGDVLTPEEAATLTFVPADGFSGTVAPVSYTVEDINGETADAAINITVLPTSSISGTVFVDDNENGIQDVGEAGIAGVEVTLIGEDINGNAVELTVLTDANGNYTFDGLVAGTYSVFQVQPEGFDDGVATSDVAGSIGSNQLNNIVLGFGDNFTSNSFSEISQITGTSGSPALLPGFLNFGGSERLNNRISNFIGGPGPVFAGNPIASNANPLTLDSGRPVTGGYATEFASPDAIADATGDCGCS